MAELSLAVFLPACKHLCKLSVAGEGGMCVVDTRVADADWSSGAVNCSVLVAFLRAQADGSMALCTVDLSRNPDFEDAEPGLDVKQLVEITGELQRTCHGLSSLNLMSCYLGGDDGEWEEQVDEVVAALPITSTSVLRTRCGLLGKMMLASGQTVEEDGDWALLAADLHDCTTLTTMDLLGMCNNRCVNAKAVQRLAEAVDGSGSVRTLCGILESQTQFEKPECGLLMQDAFLLANDLCYNSTLTCLDLSNNILALDDDPECGGDPLDDGALAIAKAIIGKHSAVRHLDISHNFLDVTAMQKVLEGMVLHAARTRFVCIARPQHEDAFDDY
jgi:hypothetical protein